MPTYDYQCQKCGYEFERVQRITEDPVKTCPKCKSRQVKRLLSAPNFILKGGGWYADGYGTSKPGGQSGGDDSGGDTSKGKQDKADSKGGGKTESKGGKKGGTKTGQSAA